MKFKNAENWKFKLDSLNISGVVATKKYIDDKMQRMYLGSGGTNELSSHTLYYSVIVSNNWIMHKIIISNPNTLIFGRFKL